MDVSANLATENRRVVLFCPSRSVFFLTCGEQGYALPEVSIPARQRACMHLADFIRSNWKLDAVCMGEVAPQSTDEMERYDIVEILSGAEPITRGLVAVPSSDVPALPFKLHADARLLEEILSDPHQLPLCGSPGPFSHFGWFEELKDWAEQKLSEAGIHRTGTFRQFTASASFSLVRMETTTKPVWFKAVGRPNLQEYAITAELVKAVPQFLPPVIAFHPEWHGWLSREAPGAPLSDTGNDGEWHNVAKALAELQILSLPHAVPLLSAGAHDVRIPRLISETERFFENLAHAMEKQVKQRPAPLTASELGETQGHLREVLLRLEELDLPDAVGHLDLNPGNVLISDTRPTFLDWAEAVVGPPFFAFQYFLEHFRLTFPQPGHYEREFVSAYANRWNTVVAKSKVQTAMRLIPAATVYAYTTAVSAGRDRAFIERPDVAASFRSMGRRLHRELTTLRELEPTR